LTATGWIIATLVTICALCSIVGAGALVVAQITRRHRGRSARRQLELRRARRWAHQRLELQRQTNLMNSPEGNNGVGGLPPDPGAPRGGWLQPLPPALYSGQPKRGMSAEVSSPRRAPACHCRPPQQRVAFPEHTAGVGTALPTGARQATDRRDLPVRLFDPAVDIGASAIWVQGASPLVALAAL